MQADPRIGGEVAGHRIEAVIGRGRLATVYVARHLRLGRRVALKVLDPALSDDTAFRETFLREGRLAAALDHPNVVTVYDAGEAGGILFVTMRFVDGTDLERVLRSEGSLAPARSVAIVSQVAAALDAAYEAGLVHRGIRPADILLEARPDGEHVFLSDFGITKHVAATTRVTRTGSFAGTVDYVAPEQIKGAGEVGRRADVYSLGCVLFHCVVGHAPFARESELVTIYAHLEDPPPHPSAERPGVPAALDAVVDRALAKRPEDRFETCGALATAAAAALGAAAEPSGPPLAADDGDAPRGHGSGSRSRTVAVAGIAAIAALVAVGAILAAGRDEPSAAPDPPSDTGGVVAVPGEPGDVVVAAVGEIACNSPPYVEGDLDHCRYDDTASLIDRGALDALLALGDTQYDAGTAQEYADYYDPFWGEFLSITQPVPGDREYGNDPASRPTGYFRYFGDGVEGPAGFGYYGFDLPSGCDPDEETCWHVIALNSELCLLPEGCGPPGPDASGPGTEMYRWLERDLESHPNSRYRCTLAYWHHPLFSFSSGSGETAEVRPLWDLLYAAGADVVVNANAHNYQRWDPLDVEGRLDPRGVREFVVGTGGTRKDAIASGTWPDGLAAAQDTTFGVLYLGLGHTSFTWQWASAAGQPAFEDSSSSAVECG